MAQGFFGLPPKEGHQHHFFQLPGKKNVIRQCADCSRSEILWHNADDSLVWLEIPVEDYRKEGADDAGSRVGGGADERHNPSAAA